MHHFRYLLSDSHPILSLSLAFFVLLFAERSVAGPLWRQVSTENAPVYSIVKTHLDPI